MWKLWCLAEDSSAVPDPALAQRQSGCSSPDVNAGHWQLYSGLPIPSWALENWGDSKAVETQDVVVDLLPGISLQPQEVVSLLDPFPASNRAAWVCLWSSSVRLNQHYPTHSIFFFSSLFSVPVWTLYAELDFLPAVQYWAESVWSLGFTSKTAQNLWHLCRVRCFRAPWKYRSCSPWWGEVSDGDVAAGSVTWLRLPAVWPWISGDQRSYPRCGFWPGVLSTVKLQNIPSWTHKDRQIQLLTQTPHQSQPVPEIIVQIFLFQCPTSSQGSFWTSKRFKPEPEGFVCLSTEHN